MATIFKFLKEYDKSAYKLARNMERTLYKEPVGALAFGGRFLELIRNSLYQYHYKDMNKAIKGRLKTTDDLDIKSESFKREDLTYHISSLYHNKLIKAHESEKIIGAYNIRHNLHLNEDIDDINSDKEAALKLYKEVFEIAKWYCRHIDNTFDTDIEFSYPSESDIEEQIPEVNIAKIFNDCVICGKENKSLNRNICPECKRKIRLGSDLEDLIDLLNNDNRFTKEFLKKQSYDTYEIDYMLHFLREFDLRSSETKGEFFLNYDKSYDFIEETKSYEEIERILLAFYNELMDADDIDYSETSYYKLGESGNDIYSQFYLLIITKKIKNYLNLKSKSIPNACEKAKVDIEEISNWYDRKVRNILKLNYKKDLDISFNQMSRILMGKWIEYRENNEKKEDIKSKLKLSDEVLGFWLDESLIGNNKYPYITEFIYKNRELEMKLFVEGLSSGLNKQDAIEFADTSAEFVNKYFNLNDEKNLIKRWRIGKQTNNEESFKTYKNIYFHNKTKEFLDYLNGNDIDSALMKSDLDEEDFNKWYDGGKREFFRYDCDLDSDLFKFYAKTTKVLMKNWLEERKSGHKRSESCKNIGLYSATLDEWFRFEDECNEEIFTNPKYKVFRNFYNENNELNMDLIIQAIERGENKQRFAKTTDIPLAEIDALYEVGKYFNFLDGLNKDDESSFSFHKELYKSTDDKHTDEYMEFMDKFYENLEERNRKKFIDFYNKYEELYHSKHIDEFLNLCEKKGDIPKAMKVSELGEGRITFMYENGKVGDEEYKDFYERLLKTKIHIYVALMSSRDKRKRALKSSGLTEEELEENSERIENFKLTYNMLTVLNEHSKRKKIEKIVNKAPFSINDVFDWYLKGKELMEESEEEYLEIDDLFETNRINLLEEFEKIDEGDTDRKYMKFYNIYNEIHVKPSTKMLSINYTEDKDFLRRILKDLKVSKKEYDFWMELGLIKNERDIDLTEEEEEERKKMKVKRI